MRTPFLAFAIVAAVAAVTFGTGAFNYGTTGTRAVSIAIVQDDSAYIAIQSQDSNNACFVSYAGTGKITVAFNGGSGCSGGGGSGINGGSQYYFLDMLKITNKGNKAWQGLWVNSSDAAVKVNLTFSTDSSMTAGPSGSTFAQNDAFVTPIATSDVIYVGFYIDGSSKTTSDSPWSVTFNVAARATA